jgi:endonuclease/exonuclease/phosphatase family metal-dependent hydrolase
MTPLFAPHHLASDGRRTARRPRAAALAALLLCLAGRPAAAADYRQPVIKVSDDKRTATMQLDVLTYNLEGVPWREGRKEQLKEIGKRLAAMRAKGQGPDIVLFQEAFSDDAKAAVRKAGYAALVRGPNRLQRRSLPGESDRQGHKWTKGELGLRFVGSGLAVASVYPIKLFAGEPFSRRACAGFDCLSNKGGLFARIAVPGMPDPLDIFDTHMNAQGASRVKASRHLPVYEAQVLELGEFIDKRRDMNNPTILGGDFNMRRSEARFSFFEGRQPLDLVQRYCAERRSECDVRISWDGDAPWMDTQDLQLFSGGARVDIRPVRVETLFDGKPGSPKLSDHDGFRVIYQLTWSLADKPPVAVASR